MNADTGRIAAATVTTDNIDDASQVGPLFDQVDGPVASFRADGAYDQDGVYGEVRSRHPEASVIVPPRRSAVPSDTAQTVSTVYYTFSAKLLSADRRSNETVIDVSRVFRLMPRGEAKQDVRHDDARKTAN